MSPESPVHPSRFFEWRDEWTLEVGFMDEDHRMLAGMLSRIAREFGDWSGKMQGKTDPSALLAALDDLGHHVREHFAREEDVMRTLGYPDFPAHKSEHAILLAEYSMTVREIQESGSTRLDMSAVETLKTWLMGHVLEADRQLADFLKKAENGSGEKRV